MLEHPSIAEAKPLFPDEAAQLKKKIQQTTMLFEKENFDPQPVEEIVYRLLAARKDLAIVAEENTPRLLYASEFIVNDLSKLEDLFIYDRKIGQDDTREAILNLFPSDIIGDAFIQAVGAACRMEELKQKKDKKNQERAFNNFLHLIHAFNILASPQKALSALQKRQAFYQRQIEAHQRNIENSKKQKRDFDIPRSQENIQYFQSRLNELQPYLNL